MVKALYRLFFQYNVNVLGFQNMLHVYDVKRFFYYALLYEAVSKIQLASDVIQSSSYRAMKILQQKEYAYVLCM